MRSCVEIFSVEPVKKQTSFPDAEFSGKKRVTQRENLLTKRNSRIPWASPHSPFIRTLALTLSG